MSKLEYSPYIQFGVGSYKKIGHIVINGPIDTMRAPMPTKKELKSGSSFPYSLIPSDDGDMATWRLNTYAISKMTAPQSRNGSIQKANDYISSLVEIGDQKPVLEGSSLRLNKYAFTKKRFSFEAELKDTAKESGDIAGPVRVFEDSILPKPPGFEGQASDTKVTNGNGSALEIRFAEGVYIKRADVFDGGYDVVGFGLANGPQPLVGLFAVAKLASLAGK